MARTTGSPHLDASSGGAYHRWLALRCLIRRRVPPVARTWMPHQATRTTGGLHLDASSGGAYHRWLALGCLIRRRVPPPTLSPARLQFDCSENVDEEAAKQWINEDLTLECCEVLSDDDIVSRVTCGSEGTRNFEECSESDEENLVTHQKLSHGGALVHNETLLNYLEQEDESTPADKNDIEKSA
ncbi:hypothetical protein AVEN_56330-1 [Araneus ventricosus]|uniref:Uncharacterized protein n=1 Tax=Araneus ventricosus TaxID=182803 RepID=A0A4Y2ISE9_ARAVE|nr:hypothetical protein AVEN_56330-1 [Araneus ventricosus]